MQDQMPHQPGPPLPLTPSRRAGDRVVQAIVGLLLIVPALLALLVSYGWPTLRTFLMSTQAVRPFGDESEPIGFDNYQRVTDTYTSSPATLAFPASLAVMLMLVLAVVALLLGWLASLAGRPTRLVVRLALALPMVCFVPVGLATGWQLDRLVGDPDGAQGAVRGAVWLGMFGLMVGWGVTCYLAAFRNGRAQSWLSRWAAAGTVAALALLTAAAVAVASFTYPFVMTGGGPVDATMTPLLHTYRAGLTRLEFGFGAAHSVMVLLPLMLLGLLAAALVIGTGLRIEVEAPERRGGTGNGDTGRLVATIATFVVVALVLAISLYGLWPWLSRPGFGPTEDLASPSGMLVRTWFPPLLTAVVGVGLAAVAAFGIGALRPLGRWSELLLLPFAPWLFVGIAPLMIAKYESAMSGLVQRVDSPLGAFPPVGLVVPALFVLTVLFRGLATGHQGHGGTPAPYGRMILWSLPMVALLTVATWLVQSQSLLWGLLMFRGEPTVPVWIGQTVGRYAASRDVLGFGLLLPLPLLGLLALGLLALQLFYLDRLAIRVGPGGLPPAGDGEHVRDPAR